jgi:hypothetical protein
MEMPSILVCQGQKARQANGLQRRRSYFVMLCSGSMRLVVALLLHVGVASALFERGDASTAFGGSQMYCLERDRDDSFHEMIKSENPCMDAGCRCMPNSLLPSLSFRWANMSKIVLWRKTALQLREGVVIWTGRILLMVERMSLRDDASPRDAEREFMYSNALPTWILFVDPSPLWTGAILMSELDCFNERVIVCSNQTSDVDNCKPLDAS